MKVFALILVYELLTTDKEEIKKSSRNNDGRIIKK